MYGFYVPKDKNIEDFKTKYGFTEPSNSGVYEKDFYGIKVQKWDRRVILYQDFSASLFYDLIKDGYIEKISSKD